MRLAPRARQAKGKARLGAYEKLLAEAQRDEGHRAASSRSPSRPVRASATPSSRSRTCAKAYGDKLLIDGLTFSLPKAGIVGIIGANGAGKTTLFRMIVGQEPPDAERSSSATPSSSPTSTRAATTSRATSRSSRRSAAATSSSRSGRASSRPAPTCRSFNFRGTDQQKPVGKLSGGERNRVHLAKLLRSGGNVLLLDEPTNDLDVDTLRALEAGLESFPGCAVVISHDRWFLDRIATHVLAFEGDSVVRWFEGNFTEYEEFRHRELGTAADQPHRIRYKRLAG